MEINASKIGKISSALQDQRKILKFLVTQQEAMIAGKEIVKDFSETIERIEKAIRPWDQFRDSPSYP